MALITFKDLPDKTTPLNASNLNNNFQAIYPVGSIYMSVLDTNPETLFGFGTWEKIEGAFLYGANSTHTLGSTGGEETHTLTIDEMPKHSHGLSHGGQTWIAAQGAWAGVAGDWGEWNTNETGGDGAHNNMPPYLAVNIWKRTA